MLCRGYAIVFAMGQNTRDSGLREFFAPFAVKKQVQNTPDPSLADIRSGMETQKTQCPLTKHGQECPAPLEPQSTSASSFYQYFTPKGVS